jgi:hypothetical protein
MTRGGVARLVVAETLAMLVPGWLLGFCGAALALQVFLWLEPIGGGLPRVVSMGWPTVAWSALLALVVGGAASIAPVWRSMRVKPLEVTGADVTESRPFTWWKAVFALALLAPLPVFSLLPSLPPKTKSWLMVGVGMPCFLVSVFLGMQPVMRLTELLFLRPLGWALCLSPALLQRRLSRDPARAMGTILTLSLGLGGFIAIHLWGGTLMSSFVPSPEWPDVIVSALPGGFTSEQVAAVRRCAGVADGRVLELECTQFPMELPDGTKPECVLLLFGSDP